MPYQGKMERWLLLLLLAATMRTSVLSQLSAVDASSVECPWYRDPRFQELVGTCVCSGAGAEASLSVHCQFVKFPLLVSAMQSHAQGVVVELLYVNNSTVERLTDFVFKNLKIINLQISHAGLQDVSPNAFRGLEDTLQNLNLAGNQLRYVPVEPLRQLRLISLLDLSGNRIKFVPNNAFVTLRLKTLKLADNNLTLADNSVRGLDSSLKNLNLKGCQLKKVPDAIRALKSLAFLDLAQNTIRNVEPGTFRNLDSLTALNLERNIIQKFSAGVFEGVTDTLSSLSLLNNLLTEYPIAAINSLKELRVLDLGFNLLRVLPATAFYGVTDLTLLALDGNPMATLPEEAFTHLNGSLRGLSLGGRFLTCDCNVRWVARWIRDHDLQVTSRERNPQFCGHPQHLRDKNFYQLGLDDLACGPPKQPLQALRPVTPVVPTPPPPPPPTTTRTTTTTTRRTTPPPQFRPPPAYPRQLQPVAATGMGRPVLQPLSNQASAIKPGDIVTEIKMTVGQNSDGGGRSRAADGPKVFNGGGGAGRRLGLPPPKVVSSSPSPNGADGDGLLLVRQNGLLEGQAFGAAASAALGRGGFPPAQPPPAPSNTLSRININPTPIMKPRVPPTRPRNNLRPKEQRPPRPPRPFPQNDQPVDRPRSVPPPEPPEPKIINKSEVGIGRGQNNQPLLRAELDVRPRQDGRVLDRPAAISIGPEEVIMRDAYKDDNSIVIKWESEVTNILGFRVVYRLFGKPEFKQGPPLAPSEREFRIKNVPSDECIVVCVVSLEELKITPGNVPYEQCREIRTEGAGKGTKKLDWIIIPASAAIVATVIIAVIIFIACIKSSHKSREAKILEEKPIHTLSMSGMGTMGPGPPLAGLATLGLAPPTAKEWDQMSMYSQHSQHSRRHDHVPRSRMYQMDRPGSVGRGGGGYIPEDARSHLSAMSGAHRHGGHGGGGGGGGGSKSKSIGDLTGRSAGLLGLSRQDLRQSRQSLVSHLHDGRQSRAASRAGSRRSGFGGGGGGGGGGGRPTGRSVARRGVVAGSVKGSDRAPSLRSRSRDRINPGYISNHDEEDSLEESASEDEEDEELDDDEDELEDNWANSTATGDNWTDYDQDIYMHRNTRKFGHSTGGMFSKDDVNL